MVALISTNRLFVGAVDLSGAGPPNELVQVFPPPEGSLMRRGGGGGSAGEGGGAPAPTPLADEFARLVAPRRAAARREEPAQCDGPHLLPWEQRRRQQQREEQERERERERERAMGCGEFPTLQWSPCDRRLAFAVRDLAAPLGPDTAWRTRLFVLEFPPEYAHGGGGGRLPSRMRLLVDEWRRPPASFTLEPFERGLPAWRSDGRELCIAVTEGAPVRPAEGQAPAWGSQLAMVMRLAAPDTPEGGRAFWEGADGGADAQGDWAVVDAAAAEPSPSPWVPRGWPKGQDLPRADARGRRRVIPMLIERAPQPTVAARDISDTLTWLD
jgi:hypothetical protein